MTKPKAVRGSSETGDPLLLTPGPLTTSKQVKEVMVHDWGSRDATFLGINKEVLDAAARDRQRAWARIVTVPMQGSGTFAVEAMLTTFVPRDGKVLILINGAYGQRAKKICDIAGRAYAVHETPEDTPPDLAAVDAMLQGRSRRITHVFAVHCETTSGILNPIAEIAALVQKHGAPAADRRHERLRRHPARCRARRRSMRVAASSNKCIEGVPGLGFVICRKAALAEAKGNATTLVLDLHDQWQNFAKTGQYRFTPPIHVIVAFHQALTGVRGRGRRRRAAAGAIAENCKVLIDGMRALGFETLLPDRLQAPIIVTFHMPADPKFVFQGFYDRLKDRGYVIYPGKLTVADSFRIGCIGRLYADHMRGALAAVAEVLAELGVTDLKSAA